MPHCTFIREGKVCGAPAYQDPCPACIAHARTISERAGMENFTLPKPISVNARPSISTLQNGTHMRPAPAPNPADPVIDLLGYPQFRALHNLFHHLWTKNVGGHQYDKKEWQYLENAIDELARTGVGPYDPHSYAQEYRQGLYDEPTKPTGHVPIPVGNLPPSYGGTTGFSGVGFLPG